MEEMLAGHDSYAEVSWKSGQVSHIGHYRCLTEAVHYLLRRKGLSAPEAKAVMFGFRAQATSTHPKPETQTAHPLVSIAAC